MSEANPELFAQWRDETEADTHLLGSGYSALWEGACGHQWRATISSRMAGKGCPLCSGNRAVAGVNDLATLRPNLVVEWSKKNDKTPAEVTTGSAYIAIWECAAHRHEYTMMVAQHAREGRGCPVCSGRRILTGFNDFATANPDMAAEFVRDAEGKGRTPHTVGANSHAKFIWRCAEGHEWPSEPAQRSAGMKCRVCRGRKSARPARPTRSVVRALPPKNRPLTIAEHSPDLVAEFVCDSENLGRTPHNTARGSNANLHWRCLACNFEYVSPPRHRTAGRGCPACAGTVIVPGNNDLATKFPDIAAELDDENYTADQLLPNSNIMVQWKCANGHTWNTRVFNRTRGDSGCNTCVRKEFSSVFERDILALVTATLPGEDITPTARSIVKNRELDMYVPGRGIAIEANGVYWHTEKFGKTERYHANKAEACAEQGINLITIWEDDWKARRTGAEAVLRSMLNPKTPGALQVDSITLDEANAYLIKHSLEAPVTQNSSKSYPFAAVGAQGDEGGIAAVVIYHKTPERALRIDRYAADGASPRYLEWLIDHLEGTVTGYDHILYDDNSERSQRAVFEQNEFVVRNKLNPRHTLVKGSTRYAPGAPEVNDGGAYEKAWDCGGTVYRRERKNPVSASVTVSAPELLAEWRSGDISPDETLIGSGKVVEWECPNGHHWSSKVFERTKRGRGCPACRSSGTSQG